MQGTPTSNSPASSVLGEAAATSGKGAQTSQTARKSVSAVGDGSTTEDGAGLMAPTPYDSVPQRDKPANQSTGSVEETPPPMYSETYGRVILHQNGLNTTANVSDDGRVNIKIAEDSKFLSHLLAPALRKQLNNQERNKLPENLPGTLSPSVGRESESLDSSPPLNIVIHVVGSRGDVQPFVALGKELKANFGHRVRLATHPNFREFVTENGLEFFSIGGDPAELMAFMVRNPGLMPGKDALRKGEIRKRRQGMHEIIHGCWRSCFEAGDGTGAPVSDAQPSRDFDAYDKPFVADAIIANPPSFAHLHCAEKLGIPVHLIFTMPWSPTQSFPHPLANIQESSTDPSVTNFLSYALVELMTWQGLGDIVNRFRENALGLEPLSLMWAPGLANRLKVPYTYCWSPSLIPKPQDWANHISVSGFLFLECSNDYQPSKDLAEFLAAGPPPVYIGFGSIVVDDPNSLTETIFEAVKKTGHRALVSKGWGGLGDTSLDIPSTIFMLGNVPHDWLFKHVSCVVHHGGAGTTAAGIAHGKPTVIVPFFGDQPFWGAMVARAGAGPDPIHNKALDVEKLAAAIAFALKPPVLQKAQELGFKMVKEKGTVAAAQSFHNALDTRRMKCSLVPGRAAAWNVRNTSINLSALAAAVLGNAALLDLEDLQLLRTKEYDTDATPWDPIGGGASALASTIGNLMMGVADIPTEIFSIFASKSRGSKDPSSERTEHEADTEKASGKVSTDQPITLDSVIHTGKGVGRIVDVGLRSPMDFTLALAKGFHNAPRLYGDRTVRSPERVTDLRSGIKAASKGFSQGFYDGISGLVSQPIEGAKKGGFAGLVKGFGKGIGGVVLKPGAAVWGIPAYTFQGIYKELRKLYGPSVHNYIIAARTAQGYDEWKSCPEEERRNIIKSWKTLSSSSIGQSHRPLSRAGIDQGTPMQHQEASLTLGSALATDGDSGSKLPTTENDEMERAIKNSVIATSTGDSEEDLMIERAIRASVAELRSKEHPGRSLHPNMQRTNPGQANDTSIVSTQASDTVQGPSISSRSPAAPGSQALQMSHTREEHGDAEMQQALKESAQSKRDREAELHEEEIIMKYVLRQSLAEASSEAKLGTNESKGSQ